MTLRIFFKSIFIIRCRGIVIFLILEVFSRISVFYCIQIGTLCLFWSKFEAPCFGKSINNKKYVFDLLILMLLFHLK